jgi:hypothetical protein
MDLNFYFILIPSSKWPQITFMAGFQIRKGLIEGGLLGGKSEVVEGL